jgi:hypothetical protein
MLKKLFTGNREIFNSEIKKKELIKQRLETELNVLKEIEEKIKNRSENKLQSN